MLQTSSREPSCIGQKPGRSISVLGRRADASWDFTAQNTAEELGAHASFGDEPCEYVVCVVNKIELAWLGTYMASSVG